MSYGAHNIPDGSSVEEVAQQSTQETGNIILGDVRPASRVIRDIIDRNNNPNFISASDCPINEYLKPSII